MTTAAEWSRSPYGHDEMNGLINGANYHETVDHSRTYSLSEIQALKGKISRIRFLTEVMPGRGRVCDVSYIHATLPDGKIVPVQSLLDNLIPRYRLKSHLIDWAKRERVYAIGVGLLDESNWSILN